MRAALGQAAVLEDENAVAGDDAGQPVGEHERRAPLHEPLESLLDQPFAFRIDRRERLVEHQHRGVAQQCPSDRNALALAARQAYPALPHHRPIAVGKPGNKLVGVGGARCRLQLVLGRLRLAHTEVILDRAVEQVRVLIDDGNGAAQTLLCQRAGVDAAQPHGTRVRIEQAQQKFDHGRLAGAARPDDAHPFAGRDREAEAAVGRMAARPGR